tara:strand:+ start:1713 stop:1943 length:231 start_codon:yes stop_codon:yes gene_type:complete
MVELLGWICTLLVIIGFYANAKQRLKLAIILWVIGDVGWVVYDVLINNFSHGVLSGLIIGINIYGLYNLNKGKDDK